MERLLFEDDRSSDASNTHQSVAKENLGPAALGIILKYVHHRILSARNLFDDAKIKGQVVEQLDSYKATCKDERGPLALGELVLQVARIQVARQEESNKDNTHIGNYRIEAEQVIPAIEALAKDFGEEACHEDDKHFNGQNGQEDVEQVPRTFVVSNVVLLYAQHVDVGLEVNLFLGALLDRRASTTTGSALCGRGVERRHLLARLLLAGLDLGRIAARKS